MPRRKPRASAANAAPSTTGVDHSRDHSAGLDQMVARSRATAADPAPSGVPSATSAIPAAAEAETAAAGTSPTRSHPDRGGDTPAHATDVDTTGGTGSSGLLACLASRSPNAASGTRTSPCHVSARPNVRSPSTVGNPDPCNGDT
jgi:hypothetical protein